MDPGRSRRYKFSWKIKNFSYITQNDMECIESPGFYPYSVKEDRLTLQFYPEGIMNNDETSLAGDDEAVILISNFDTMRDKGILSEVKVGIERVDLRKTQPNEFVLKIEELGEILKREDVISFLCILHPISMVDGDRWLKDDFFDHAAVTKAEINREIFQTTINFQNAAEHRFSVVSTNFVIFLIVSDGFLNVIIELNEKDKQIRKTHYICGKFFLVAAKSTDVLSFDVQRYFDRDVKKTEWIGPAYKFEYSGVETFYFSCDIKTNGIQSDKIHPTHLQRLYWSWNQRRKDHLRYVSITNMYPDILVRVEDKNIAAHQIILASRSPVLASLIKNNESCVVEIKYYDLKTVKKFLDFLYRDEFVACNSKEVLKLASMAEFYEVDTLAAKCISLYITLKANHPVREASTREYK